MKKGRPKKENRMAETNIKVTKETHREIQVATDLARQTLKTQSEVISLALNTLFPNLGEEIRRRDELEKAAAERTIRE